METTRFRDKWKSRTRHLSNTAQIALDFAYQQITGIGPEAVPLILTELKRETDHWFWALEAITGENPVTSEQSGDIEATACGWIEWGRKNGHLNS